MSKTHAVFETPNGDLEILSCEETGLSDDQFYNLRNKQTIEYDDDGIYTFIFSGTHDQCRTQLTRIASLTSHITPIKPVYSPQHTSNRTPLLAPPQAVNRTPLLPRRSPSFSS
jgi:hypothetical protein